MNIADLLSRLQAQHHHDLQSCQTISAALAEVEHGLGMLARVGHVYHLEPGPSYPLPEWPRILFHVSSAPNGRVVNSPWEALELGDGWWPTLAEAQNKEGVRAQFMGRGGVGDRSLPMLADSGPPAPRGDYTLPSTPNDNHDIISEFKARVRSNSDDPGDVSSNAGTHPREGTTEAAAGEGIHG